MEPDSSETTKHKRAIAALEAFLRDAPEIDDWVHDAFTPAQRDAYARARGWAKDALNGH